MAKIDIVQPVDFTRVAPNTAYDIIFKLNYFATSSTSAVITVKLSDTADFASSVTLTPTTIGSRVAGTTPWTGTITGNTILLADVGKEFKYTMTFPNENKVKYMKIICTEGVTVTELNPILMTSIYNLAFTLTVPIQSSIIPTRVKVVDKKTIVNPGNITIKVEATNNALDAAPVWQNITNEYTNGNFATLTNTTKEAAKAWAINVRYTIVKSSALSTVDFNEVFVGFA